MNWYRWWAWRIKNNETPPVATRPTVVWLNIYRAKVASETCYFWTITLNKFSLKRLELILFWSCVKAYNYKALISTENYQTWSGEHPPPTHSPDYVTSSPNSIQCFPNSNNDHLWRLRFTIFTSLIKTQAITHFKESH